MHGRLFVGLIACCFWFDGTARSAEPVVFACNEFPPFKMENSDTGLKGFDVDFLEEIFRRADIALKIVYLPWKRALREAQRGEVNGVCSCSRTAERDSYLTYSAPLGRASSGLFSLAENKFPPLKKLEEIESKSVSVILGYNLIENLAAAGIQNIVQVASEIQGAKVLINGRTDYFYGYKEPVLFNLKQLGTSEGIAYNEIAYSEYYACFSKNAKGMDLLVERFNRGLKTIQADGTYDQILSKYR